MNGIVTTGTAGTTTNPFNGTGTGNYYYSFQSAGTYTLTNNTGKDVTIYYTLCGGGGGGGNANQSGSVYTSGGGGGAGGFVQSSLIVSNNTTITIVAGSAGAANTNGGNSTLTYSGSTYTANGGIKGANATTTAGGAGGASGNGGTGGLGATSGANGGAGTSASGSGGGYLSLPSTQKSPGTPTQLTITFNDKSTISIVGGQGGTPLTASNATNGNIGSGGGGMHDTGWNAGSGGSGFALIEIIGFNRSVHDNTGITIYKTPSEIPISSIRYPIGAYLLNNNTSATGYGSFPVYKSETTTSYSPGIIDSVAVMAGYRLITYTSASYGGTATTFDAMDSPSVKFFTHNAAVVSNKLFYEPRKTLSSTNLLSESYTNPITSYNSGSFQYYHFIFSGNGTLINKSSSNDYTIYYYIVGGGGGGGGTIAATEYPTGQGPKGGGGGGGGYIQSGTITFQRNSQLTITIGSGGSGGASNISVGNAGSASSILILATNTTITANGGNGGGGGAYNVGNSAGGTGGANGGDGNISTSAVLGATQTTNFVDTSSTSTIGAGGNGGYKISTGGANGANGATYGCGGGGASTSDYAGGTFAGGNGFSGVVMITIVTNSTDRINQSIEATGNSVSTTRMTQTYLKTNVLEFIDPSGNPFGGVSQLPVAWGVTAPAAYPIFNTMPDNLNTYAYYSMTILQVLPYHSIYTYTAANYGVATPTATFDNRGPLPDELQWPDSLFYNSYNSIGGRSGITSPLSIRVFSNCQYSTTTNDVKSIQYNNGLEMTTVPTWDLNQSRQYTSSVLTSNGVFRISGNYTKIPIYGNVSNITLTTSLGEKYWNKNAPERNNYAFDFTSNTQTSGTATLPQSYYYYTMVATKPKPLCFMFWVYIPGASISQPMSLFGLLGTTLSETNALRLQIGTNNQLTLSITGAITQNVTTTISMNTWTHIAVNMTSSANCSYEIYKNGVFDTSATVATTNSTSWKYVAIGGGLYNGTTITGQYQFTGYMHDITLYSRALTSTEINDEYTYEYNNFVGPNSYNNYKVPYSMSPGAFLVNSSGTGGMFPIYSSIPDLAPATGNIFDKDGKDNAYLVFPGFKLIAYNSAGYTGTIYLTLDNTNGNSIVTGTPSLTDATTSIELYYLNNKLDNLYITI